MGQTNPRTPRSLRVRGAVGHGEARRGEGRDSGEFFGCEGNRGICIMRRGRGRSERGLKFRSNGHVSGHASGESESGSTGGQRSCGCSRLPAATITPRKRGVCRSTQRTLRGPIDRLDVHGQVGHSLPEKICSFSNSHCVERCPEGGKTASSAALSPYAAIRRSRAERETCVVEQQSRRGNPLVAPCGRVVCVFRGLDD